MSKIVPFKKKEIVTFQNIKLSYTTKHQRVDLFENLNIDFQRNEYALIVGASGTGKTSILNMMAGFLKPQEGQILINSKDIIKMRKNEICSFRNKSIGYIFQFFNLIYQFNVEENIAVPLILSGMNKNDIQNKVNDLLEKVELSHRKKHYPNELSGGEQQRVAIARALANDPDIIIADEPTGNLDVKTGDIILDVISDIHNDGKTIIMVTHNNEIMNRATRVINMNDIIMKEY